MAKRQTHRNYAKESDPEFNRQFRRRWTEPETGKRLARKAQRKTNEGRNPRGKAA